MSHRIKNAVKSFAREVAFLVSIDSEKAFTVFQELLNAIRRVKYYHSTASKSSKSRVNKGAVNKWQEDRRKKIAVAA
jgi:hypothetical protein